MKVIIETHSISVKIYPKYLFHICSIQKNTHTKPENSKLFHASILPQIMYYLVDINCIIKVSHIHMNKLGQ